MIKSDDKIKAAILLGVVFCISFAATTWARLAFSEEAQFRVLSSAKWKFDEEYSLDLEQKYHYAEDLNLKQFKNSTGITYYPLDWLSVGSDYEVNYKKGEEGWRFYHGPSLNTEVQFEQFDFKFSDRLRIEYMPGKSEPWELRDSVEVKYIGYEPIQPYISDEVFLSLETLDFLRNRAYIGFTVPVLNCLDLDAFYLLETEDDKNAHVIGAKTKLQF